MFDFDGANIGLVFNNAFAIYLTLAQTQGNRRKTSYE